MVMELLGKSIEDMVQKRGGKFTAKTSVLVAMQVVSRIEYLHSKGIVPITRFGRYFRFLDLLNPPPPFTHHP